MTDMLIYTRSYSGRHQRSKTAGCSPYRETGGIRPHPSDSQHPDHDINSIRLVVIFILDLFFPLTAPLGPQLQSFLGINDDESALCERPGTRSSAGEEDRLEHGANQLVVGQRGATFRDCREIVGKGGLSDGLFSSIPHPPQNYDRLQSSRLWPGIRKPTITELAPRLFFLAMRTGRSSDWQP